MLKIEPKSDTPGVIIDPENNQFEIYGKSLPEDASDFFAPILNKIHSYCKNPNPQTVFTINLEYYNSASVRQIISILTILEEIHKVKSDVKIIWMYEENDEMMQENGDELNETVDIPFEIKSFKFDY